MEALDRMVEAAWSALRDVEDPETGLDVVALGLIYEVIFDEVAARLHVVMTLTTPACPAGEQIADGVDRRLRRLAGVDDVTLEITFEPRWTPARISPEGRAQLGWP